MIMDRSQRNSSSNARPRGHGPALVLSSVLAVLLLPGPAHAQAYGDPAEGHRLASAWCSSCHQIEARAPAAANDAVPSYQAIAAMPSTTPMSIRAFLSTSHKVMPDFKLTDTQIDDVSAYILSLRIRRPE